MIKEGYIISRRFVRIKALQNLYAYTITAQAYRKEAIEQVKKDFNFDCFFHKIEQKGEMATMQNIAVTLCSQAIDKDLPPALFSYPENNKIQESIRKHLNAYAAKLHQSQVTFENGIHQSRDSIYRGVIYIWLLLVEWYKRTKVTKASSNQTDNLLRNQLSRSPLLETCYTNSHWINTIDKWQVSWSKDQDQLENWYMQFIESIEIPKTYTCKLDNDVKILDYIVQDIIFREGPINDFFAMLDLYWDLHKPIVQKLLTQIFMMVSTKDFSSFKLFWENLASKWGLEEAFYSHLFSMVIEKSRVYETMIRKKTEKWDSERILLTDKIILKLALAELLEREEIPTKVSINEYIEIAKWYGTHKSGIFINGVLDGILKGLDEQDKNK